ncbi:MAG: CU044_2847 family protein [Cyanobacteria bacterium P01_A01_bin.84]
MELPSKIISVQLSDGTPIKVKVTAIGDTNRVYRQINSQTRPFGEVTSAIESLTKDIAESLQKIKPDKASIKFGIEIGIESGRLIVLLAKGIDSANLEITLEWNQ